MAKSRWSGVWSGRLWVFWLGCIVIFWVVNALAFRDPAAAKDPAGTAQAAGILAFPVMAGWFFVWAWLIRKKHDPPGRIRI
jgi:hypothetical protein